MLQPETGRLRQHRVMEVLREGFGPETVSVTLQDDMIYVEVQRYQGRFAIDRNGDVVETPNIPGELAYWISTDLKCLDLLERDKFISNEAKEFGGQ